MDAEGYYNFFLLECGDIGQKIVKVLITLQKAS